MKNKLLKSWRTFASESKERRIAKLTPELVERLNKIFRQIDQEQKQNKEIQRRKIAKQPEA